MRRIDNATDSDGAEPAAGRRAELERSTVDMAGNVLAEQTLEQLGEGHLLRLQDRIGQAAASEACWPISQRSVGRGQRKWLGYKAMLQSNMLCRSESSGSGTAIRIYSGC